jgi:hypothetical protein
MLILNEAGEFRYGPSAAVEDSASRVQSFSDGRHCSVRCGLQLRAEIAGNQVEEEVGGDANGASTFRLFARLVLNFAYPIRENSHDRRVRRRPLQYGYP